MGALALPELRKQAHQVFEQDEVPEEFRWMERLTPRHLRLFSAELHDAITSGDGKELREVVESWKATAEVDADPKLRSRLLAGRGKAKTNTPWRATRRRITK